MTKVTEVSQDADGSYVVAVEVFGDGIEMWMRSQGNKIIEAG